MAPLKRKTVLFLCLIFALFVFTGCAYSLVAMGYTRVDKSITDADIYYEYDNYTRATYYHHKSLTWFFADYEFYLSESRGLVAPRIKVYYSGSTWKFFSSVIFINDQGDRFSYSPVGKDEHVSDSGTVHEIADDYLNENELRAFEKVISGTGVRYSLSGRGPRKEYKLSRSEINATREMIEFYRSID
ncbi:MAG: hypothetical protein ACPKOP_04150 [Sphaerochaetaceae bacterium]